jgi:hypothetical protein
MLLVLFFLSFTLARTPLPWELETIDSFASIHRNAIFVLDKAISATSLAPEIIPFKNNITYISLTAADLYYSLSNGLMNSPITLTDTQSEKIISTSSNLDNLFEEFTVQFTHALYIDLKKLKAFKTRELRASLKIIAFFDWDMFNDQLNSVIQLLKDNKL